MADFPSRRCLKQIEWCLNQEICQVAKIGGVGPFCFCSKREGEKLFLVKILEILEELGSRCPRTFLGGGVDVQISTFPNDSEDNTVVENDQGGINTECSIFA